MTIPPDEGEGALGFMTTRELLVHRRLAQRALRRRRAPDRATAMTRIEAELTRRRDVRSARRREITATDPVGTMTRLTRRLHSPGQDT